MTGPSLGRRTDRTRTDRAVRDRRNAVRLGHVLRCGTVAAVAVIIVGSVAAALGADSTGRTLQRAGMLIIVGTPVVGLVSLGLGFLGAGDRRYLLLSAIVLLLIGATAGGVALG